MPWIKNKRNYCITSILSQFNRCSIILIFCSKKVIKNRTNTKRGLKIVFNEHHMSLEELLIHDQGISIHHTHTNALLTEIYETFSEENPFFMKSIYEYQIS